jgi:NAD+ diphosphatase
MIDPHIFSGNPLDRCECERRDEEWISDQARLPESRFLALWGSKVLINGGSQPRINWISREELTCRGIDCNPVLLGLLNQEGQRVCCFAVDIPADGTAEEPLHDLADCCFEDVRAAAEQISLPESGMLAQARAQINWHSRHGFCSVCGHSTVVKRGGQKRECPNCGAEHFPRVDPVIIMVVADGDRCLLGQSRGRLARLNRYSALAGFVEQGESIEEAVAREVKEEAGIVVRNVRYHSSQPWPFPSSLMIGCLAEAATTEIHMDPEEMTDVQWFSREEVLLALEEKSDKLMLPGRIAIAHHLIKSWALKEQV